MFLLALLFCGILFPNQITGEPLPTNHVIAAHQDFAHKLYQLLPKDKNVVFCPLSAHSILSLVLDGASGLTFDEMKTALSLRGTKSEIAAGQQEISKILQASNGLTFTIANNIYVAPNTQVKESFARQATTAYGAGIDSLNFTRPDAANVINAWVAEKTRGKITELIRPEMLSADTRAVLINAVYFLGAWREPFKYLSYPMTFHVSPSQTQSVEQMSYEGNVNYVKGANYQMVEFPYVDDNYVLRIILPSEIDNLEEIEKDVPNILATPLEPTYIQVYVPKFDIESKLDLVPLLKKLGMVSAFSEQSANFKDLTEEPIVISDVIQKAIIKVAEKGTEAAAATGATFQVTSASNAEFVRLDKSFYYALLYRPTNLSIFVGRLTQLEDKNLFVHTDDE